MDSQKFKVAIIAVIGIVAAVYLGISSATAQVETVAWVLGVAMFIACLALGRKIWLLIPFTAALAIQLRIPGQPNSLLLGQLIVLGFSTLLFLMRKIPFRFTWTELEGWILLLTLFVMQVYIRNPVGVNIFGGDTVGGKGYALYAIGLASMLLLSGIRVQNSDLKWILRVTIFGGLMNTAISLAGMVIPAIGFYTGASFNRTDEPNYENFGKAVDTGAATRMGFLSALGSNLSLWIASFISPLRAFFRPLWLILILLAIVAALMGGYRNGVATLGLTFIIGIAYRSGFGGVSLSILGLSGALAALAAVNTIHPLPPNIQRSLTFLPGTWEERYKYDAEGSSEWRFEVWREALLTDRWIKNKWLGDGLGFSAVELAAQMNDRLGTRAGISGFEAHRESVLASGDYHSGPVSTIRVIGYIGLAFFLLAQIRLGVHAHRQIIRCKGTEWFPLSLIVGIPMIWGPVFFVLIFGDFKSSTVLFLIACGMLRLLENNLPLPAYVKRSGIPVMLRTGSASDSKDRTLASGRTSA